MERKGISLEMSSLALTLLSLSELVTYVLASVLGDNPLKAVSHRRRQHCCVVSRSVLGDNLKGRLIYVNVVSSSCLAVVCIAWPFLDINFALILFTSLGRLLPFLYA